MAKKPKPAPILCPKGYRVHFTFAGKQYKKGHIKDQDVAYVVQSRVNTLVIQLKTGVLEPPKGDESVRDYIFRLAMPQPAEEENPPTVSVHHLSDLLRVYKEDLPSSLKAASTILTEKTHLRHLERFVLRAGYGDPLLADINVGFFRHYQNFRRSEKIRNDTIKKELGTFQGLWKYAVDYGHVKYNVVRDVPRGKSEVPGDRFRAMSEAEALISSDNYNEIELREIKRFRFLNRSEVEELLSLFKGMWIHPVLVALADTGMRRGEVCALEWCDVDLERKILCIKSMKQSRHRGQTPRYVPIRDRLLALLQDQKQKTGHKRWVFISPRGGGQLWRDGLNVCFRRVTTGTRFEGLGLHCLRHSLASCLAEKGVDQREINEILGHMTQEMAQRYLHISREKLRTAMEKLDGGG